MSERRHVEFDDKAYQFMFSMFPDSKKQANKDRFLATCPECHQKIKLWWYDKMPHQGGCFSCGYSFSSVFALGYRSEYKKGYREDLSPLDNLVLAYHNESKKKYRLSNRVIREFELFVSNIAKKDNKGTYNNICFPFDNRLGYIKHLNHSGRWISVPGKERDDSKWLNIDKIKPDTETIYVLAGEWDLFAFWENTDFHGISPIDGEQSAAKFDRDKLNVFSNKHVVIFFDNDRAGYAGGRSLAKRIQLFHKTKSLKVVDLSRLGLEGGEDIDDFFHKGGDRVRLFQEVESTPEFSGNIIEAETELARVRIEIERPESPDSILDDEILDSIWQTILLPESKRNFIFESIATSMGYSKEESAKLFTAEIKKYNQELETLRFIAYDILVDEQIKNLHIKQSKKFNTFESEKFWFYDDGFYSFLSESMREQIADRIARLITSPDDRKELSKVRRQALEDFNLKILDTDEVEFDSDKRYINFANGVYDLDSKELKEHSPEYLLTYKLPIKHDSDSDCPEFQKAIKIWLTTEEEQDELLKGLYYLISGQRGADKVFWLYGTGEDGKTQVSHLCRSLVGEDRTSAIAVEDLDGRHATAPLFGKLLNIADEVSTKYNISDAVFKRVSGNSLITVDPKHRDQITFQSKALWIIPSNNLPRSSDTTHGYYRRFKIFRFRRIPIDKREIGFFDKRLKPELSGIVNLLLTKGRELFERDSGFIQTATEIDLMDQMKSKNSIFAYWQHITRLSDELNEEKYYKYLEENKATGMSEEDAKDNARKKAVSQLIYQGDIDLIEPETIMQRYNHKKRGDIIIINTNKHYEFYKEHFKNDEVHPVKQSNFRTGTMHFMADHYKNMIRDVELIEIWKTDTENYGKKKNIQVIELKR